MLTDCFGLVKYISMLYLNYTIIHRKLQNQHIKKANRKQIKKTTAQEGVITDKVSIDLQQ